MRTAHSDMQNADSFLRPGDQFKGSSGSVDGAGIRTTSASLPLPCLELAWCCSSTRKMVPGIRSSSGASAKTCCCDISTVCADWYCNCDLELTVESCFDPLVCLDAKLEGVEVPTTRAGRVYATNTTILPVAVI